jgi:hypothetical protein
MMRGVTRCELRRPRRHSQPQPWLDRNELTDLLTTAEHEGGHPYALICLLRLNGLRMSEACSPNVGDLGWRSVPADPADRRQGWQARRSAIESADARGDRPGARLAHGRATASQPVGQPHATPQCGRNRDSTCAPDRDRPTCDAARASPVPTSPSGCSKAHRCVR